MNLKEKLGTVEVRLYLLFALLLALLLLLAGIVTYESYKVSSTTLVRQRQAADILQQSDQLEIDLLNLETGKRGYLLDGEERFLEPYDLGRRQFEEDLRKTRRINESAGDNLVDPETLDELEARYKSILDLFEEQIAIRRKGVTDPQNLHLSRGKTEMDRARTILDRLGDQALTSRTTARQDTEDALRRETLLAAGLGSLALLAVLGSVLYVRRGLIHPLRRLRDGAKKVGAGDLEHRVELNTTNELGTVASAFNRMLDRRHEADAAIQESENRFRGLSDATFEGVAITEGGKILETNRAFNEIFGYEPDEAVGMEALDVVAPESRELVQANMASGLEESYEAVGKRKNGEHFALEVRGKSSTYQGRAVRMSTVRDITERKRSEEALRESEERLRLALEAGRLGTWYLDLTSGEFVSSPQANAMHGLSVEDQLDNQGAMDAVHPDDRETVAEKVERAISETGSYEAEYRVVLPSGDIRWLRARGGVYGQNGSGGRLIGIVRDITESKRAEEELRKSEARARALAETATDAIITMTTDGLIRSFNPAAERIFGYTAEEAIDEPLHILMPERFRGSHERGFREYLGGREAHVTVLGFGDLVSEPGELRGHDTPDHPIIVGNNNSQGVSAHRSNSQSLAYTYSR